MERLFPIDAVRAEFPSLAVSDDGVPRTYLDAPAGTQVPRRVAEAAAHALLYTNANLGGAFRTSIAAEAVVQGAHEAMATFLNARSAREIVVAQSMTNLTLHFSRSFGRLFEPGDEIIVTRMDHDANIAPWLLLAEDRGLHVRWLSFSRDSWVIEPEALASQLSPRTRLVALNYASNLTGSINDVAALTAIAKSVGALVYVDAVQFAPHAAVDVQRLGCDALVCSSYKFFGPHLGIAWMREELLRDMTAYKVRPATDELPWKWETGTPQIEQLAALRASVDYFAWLGERVASAQTQRERIVHAYAAMSAWESELCARLIAGLQNMPGVKIAGITEPALFAQRVPTVSFTHDHVSTHTIAERLASRNIFVWSGNNYALEVVRELGIDEDAGVVRIGLAHYTTPGEIDRTLEAVEWAIASSS